MKIYTISERDHIIKTLNVLILDGSNIKIMCDVTGIDRKTVKRYLDIMGFDPSDFLTDRFPVYEVCEACNLPLPVSERNMGSAYHKHCWRISVMEDRKGRATGHAVVRNDGYDSLHVPVACDLCHAEGSITGFVNGKSTKHNCPQCEGVGYIELGECDE